MKARRPTYLLFPLAIVGLAVAFTACKKEEFKPQLITSNAAWGSTTLNDTDVTHVCLNTKASDGPHGPNAPFRTQIWADEFNGPGSEYPAVDPGCYSDDTNARCSRRLDWFGDATYDHCSAYDLTHLRGLNKCAWTLWSGYSFWDGNGKTSYNPNQIQLRQDSSINSGVLALRIHVDGNAKGDCSNEGSTVGCAYQYGGMDTKPRDGKIAGYEVTEGRVEMRVKLPSGQNGYPALWMWQTHDGADTHVAEIDLWESPRNFMTPYTMGYSHYHDWFKGGVSSIGFDLLTNIKDNLYHSIGVERTNDTLKFYVDDCYTGQVKNGEMSTGKNMAKMELNSLSEFLIMGMSATGAGFSDASSVEGQEMLVDYVRVYGR